MKKHWWKILLAAAVVMVIAGLWLQPEVDNTPELVAQPQMGPFRVTVTVTGELRAQNSVQIYGPRGTQQVGIYEIKISRLVPEGTIVKKGDFVAELDRSELMTKLREAEIEVQKAESQYTQAQLDSALTLSRARDNLVDLRYQMEEARIRREQSVFEPPSVRRQAEIDHEKAERTLERSIINYETEVQQAVAKMQEVGADLQQARNKYDNLASIAASFTVHAPDDGMVTYMRNWRGERLTEGGTIRVWEPTVAELPDLSRMESVTYVNEVDIQKIKVGQPVEVTLDAMPDKKLSGVVTHIANIGEQRPNSDAKVFEVLLEINKPDSTLRPAMTTGNTIIIAQVDSALYIPLEALHTQDSLNYVFVRRRGLIRQEVRLGLINENEAIVEAGLSPNDNILLSMPADTVGVRLERLPEPEPALATQ